MALRFVNEHTSWAASSPITWKVEIYDSAFVGDATDFEVENGANLNYRADGDSVLAPIISSSLSFSMVIQNTTHAALITDMAAGSEGRFVVQLWKDGVFHWLGVINSPDLVIEDMDYPYALELVAVDGLALLKNYEYQQETNPTNRWDARYGGIDKIITIIARCITKLPHVAGYLVDAPKFIVTAVNWYEAQHTDPATATYDPFFYTHLDNRAFGQGQSSGNGKFMSCYDVLSNILLAFNARISLVDGYFLVEQLEHRSYTIGSNQNYSRYYDYDLTAPTANTLAGAQDIGGAEAIKKLRGGSYSFLPALKSSKTTQKIAGLQNLIGGAIFNTANDNTLYTVGGVFGDGLGSFVRITGAIEWELESIDIVVNATVYGLFKMRVFLDDNYAERTATFTPGGSFGNYGSYEMSAVDWIAAPTVSYIDIPIKMEVAATGETWTGETPINLLFRTDSTFASGSLSISLRFDSLLWFEGFDSGTADPTDYALSYQWRDPYAVILKSRTGFAPESVTYEVQGTVTNSEVHETKTIIADRLGDVLNQWGGLLFDNAGDYLYTGDWGARNGTRTRPIAQLLAQRIVAAMYFPRKTLRTTTAGATFVIQDPVTDTSTATTYLLKSGTYSTVRDEMSGEWVGIEYSDGETFTYLEPVYDTGEYEANSPNGGTSNGGGSVDNGGAGSGSGGGGGNGIYGGSGSVPASTVATMAGDFGFSNSAATAGEAFSVTVDDGVDSNLLEIEAGTGILLQASSDLINLAGETALGGVVSVTLDDSQNDYAGFAGANTAYITASTAVDVTGLTGGLTGRIIAIHNRSNPVTLVNASASSTAANRFDIGEDYTIRADHGCLVQYDATDSRWRIVAADRLGRFEEAYTTSTATTASIAVDTPATNVGVAVVTKGTGAITAAVPDGTATGGNARGSYAVDLQVQRTNAADVASGTNATIPGGRRCTASGNYSFATGFRGTASGAGSVAFGGSGGFSVGATASGSNSFAFGNVGNATANYAIGFNSTASAANAVAMNYNATHYQEFAGTPGWSFMQVYKTFIVGTAATELFLDGTSLTALVPTDEAWIVEVACFAQVGIVGDGGGGLAINDTFAATYRVVIANKAGTTALIGAVQNDMPAVSDATMTDVVFTITADNTTDYLKVTYTGGANTGTTTQTNAYAALRVFKF